MRHNRRVRFFWDTVYIKKSSYFCHFFIYTCFVALTMRHHWRKNLIWFIDNSVTVYFFDHNTSRSYELEHTQTVFGNETDLWQMRLQWACVEQDGVSWTLAVIPFRCSMSPIVFLKTILILLPFLQQFTWLNVGNNMLIKRRYGGFCCVKLQCPIQTNKNRHGNSW